MRFVFGSHKHPIGEVAISSDSSQRIRGPRGNVLKIRRTLSISGTIIASTQSSITAALDQLQNGYLKEGPGAGLLMSNGQPSHHYLPQAGSLAGVQVIDGPSFPSTNGNGEYATGRSFTVTLQAEYPVKSGDALLRYSETISIQGNGGPKLVVHEVNRGDPQVERTLEKTKVIVKQYGQAVGYYGRPVPNSPIFPQYMSGETPVVDWTSAEEQNRLIRTGFPVKWSYTFVLPHFPGALYPLER